MEDVWTAVGNKDSLVCRAKEVSLEYVKSPVMKSCKEGEMIVVDLDSRINMNSGRYDFGWYVATDGGDGLTGSCALKSLGQTDTYTATGGTVTFDQDSNGNADSCGDVVASTNASLDIKLARQLELTCTDINKDGYLDFSICFTWRTDSTDNTCDPNALTPGSADKCDCMTYDVPEITVTKAGTHSTCI
jgi:hypothetical protein